MTQLFVSIIVFLACFFVSFLLNFFLIGFAKKIGFVDIPSGRKKHGKPIPLMGGVGMFFAIVIVSLMPYIFIKLWYHPFIEYFPFLKDYIDGYLKKSPLLLKIFLISLFVLIVGLYDDKKGMNPYVKLFFQFLAGVFVYFLGVKITLFVKSEVFSFFVTSFWFVLLMNSFNLLDNMDGLSSGIAFVISIVMFMISYFFENFLMSGLCAAFAGVLLGFLILNFNPAKIFMGDAGSMFVGFMMAVISVLTTYSPSPAYPKYVVYLVPLIVMMVPIYDTLSVIAVRIAHKKPIFQGDRNHFSHRLVSLGMSIKYAVIFLYFITFTTGISALLLFWVNLTGALLVILQVMCLFAIIVILEYYAERK